MTDGTSQGLFIVVAIVIFGIFVVLAYILFEDTLSPTLASMFTDATEKAASSLENPIHLEVVENENGSKTIIASNGSGMDIESIVLTGKDKDINLMNNGDFTKDMDTISEQHGEKWVGRNMFFNIDKENTINGNPSLRVEFLPDDERVGTSERDFYLNSLIPMHHGDKLRVKFDAFGSHDNQLNIRLGSDGIKNTERLAINKTAKSFEVELERIVGTNSSIIFKPTVGTTLWISNIDIQYVDMPLEFQKYATESAFNIETGKLEVRTDKLGVYEFAMKTKSGKTYYNKVILD